jgi:DUF971 family protein
MNELTKMQVETLWDVEFEGNYYTVVQMEDENSGYYSWDIIDENMEEPNDEIKAKLIEFIINNQ